MLTFDLGSIATAGASMYGAAQSAKAQRETNAANAEMAREQMAFQERMSSTAMQRARKDAEAAGFNPILATGHPASTPMGSSAVMQNPKPNRGELYLATAKALADTMLTKEMVKTEQTKQELNRAETSVKGGVINVPGVGTIPLDRAISLFKNGGRQVASTASQFARPSSNGYASGKFNKAGQPTGR